MGVSRTMGPLHLEDLEPHRFEDLIRQLLYDFCTWRRLEATGRAGTDSGFDARGWQIVQSAAVIPVDDEDVDSDDSSKMEMDDRLWLVQCKREKSIGPTKLAKYIADLDEAELKAVHGIVFVAACDFSKEARDLFRESVCARGVKEWHLWGKAEIEDRLFRPQNDHLLFAYFGFSLQIRKRSLASTVRSQLATKRKALSRLRDFSFVLLRDSTDDRYPFMDPDANKRRHDRRRWVVFNYLGIRHDGLRFQTRRHFAFVDGGGVSWDYAETLNECAATQHFDPWAPSDVELFQSRAKIAEIAETIPRENRGYYEAEATLPFDAIIDIDAKGDDYFEGPHIYTTEFDSVRGPFIHGYASLRLEIDRPGFDHQCDQETRVALFPREPWNVK